MKLCNTTLSFFVVTMISISTLASTFNHGDKVFYRKGMCPMKIQAGYDSKHRSITYGSALGETCSYLDENSSHSVRKIGNRLFSTQDVEGVYFDCTLVSHKISTEKYLYYTHQLSCTDGKVYDYVEIP